MPPDVVELEILPELRDEGQETTTPDARNTVPVTIATPQPQSIPVPEADLGIQATFDAVLATTKVYDRVKNRDVDAMTSVSTTRPHPWSALPGASLAEISVIAVISLIFKGL